MPWAESHAERLDAPTSVSAYAVAGVCAVVVNAALVCLVVELLTGAEEALTFVALAALAASLGALLLHRYRLPPATRTSALLLAVVSATGAAVAFAAVPYLTTGALNVDAAIFEAVAGITTTSSTAIADPGELGHGVTLWRAATQWLGAAGVVLMVVVVLPELGIGGLDPGGVVTRSARRVAPRSGAAVRRLGSLYLGLTVVAGVGYLLAGMPAFEALFHALTTASTGGFSTRPESLAGFDSAGVEIVAIVVMAIAGTSLPLLWRVLRRRDFGSLGRSVEMRAYLLVLLFVAAADLLGSGFDEGVARSIRTSVFAATSAVSTTGFVLEPLSDVAPGTAAVLILAMGAGGMAASLSGGFKLVRVLAVYGYVRRELIRQLHPDSRSAVRIGSSAISESMASRMIASISLSLALLVVGALVLSSVDPALESSTAIVDSVSIAVTSVANAGPADFVGATVTWPTQLGVVGRMTSAVLMIIGRVEVTPVLVAAAAIGDRGRVLLPARRSHAELDR